MSRIAVLALAALGMSCDGASSQEPDLGKRPDWRMTLPDGRVVQASDYDGKVVIVDI